MVSVSLCMIVKNEENVLARCLNSVKDLMDEIIIVDTGSVDGTIKIAEQYTEKIYQFEWINDFSAARNFSFSKATKEYIFWLDADDVLLPEDRQKFLELKNQLDPSVDTVRMIYALSRDAKGRIINSLHGNRLVRASKNFKWTEDCIRACDLAAESYLQLERADEAESILYESFLYDSPRANICCKRGYIYLHLKKNYRQALYWYKAATQSDLEYARSTGALTNAAFYIWLPHLQLCVCYDTIGNHTQAYYHNEIARLFESEHPSIVSNKQYFESILTKKEMEEADARVRAYSLLT